jgi:putative GTP pyrophosphokinase
MEKKNYPNRNSLKTKYDFLYPLYVKLLEDFKQEIEKLLSTRGVRGSVKFRVKAFSSYFDKILRKMNAEKGVISPPVINDILGVRIVCPFLENLKQAEEALRSEFHLKKVERKGAEESFKEFGYRSVHLLVIIPESLKNAYPDIDQNCCEVQIRTILQDAWSEVEHELVYKADFTPYDEPLRRKLAALNANLSLSDIIFQEIRDYQRQLHSELEKRRITFLGLVEEEKPGPVPSAKTEHTTYNGSNSDAFLSDNVDELLLNALYAHNKGDFPRAIHFYNSILENNPDVSIRSVILIHRGMAFFGEADYTAALNNFLMAADLDPNNFKVFYYQGIVYRVMDKTSEAIGAFLKSIDLDPYYFESLFGLSQTFFEISDFPAALEYCNKALKIFPDSNRAIAFRKHITESMKL